MGPRFNPWSENKKPMSHVARPGGKKKKLMKQVCQFRERIFPESVSLGAAEMESLVDGVTRLGWPRGPSPRESALARVSWEAGTASPRPLASIVLL